LETNVAVQITANTGWRNGAANDATPGELAVLLMTRLGRCNVQHVDRISPWITGYHDTQNSGGPWTGGAASLDRTSQSET